MRKRVLLIEDYEEKAQDILAFIHQSYPGFDVLRCSSYNSAQEMIFEAETAYDLILLDMSMSSYELKDDATGGLPEPSAGQNILEGMFLRNIVTPVIVITMYNVFGRKELSVFHEELKSSYPQNYRSYVFYSSQKSDWRNNLAKRINEVLS